MTSNECDLPRGLNTTFDEQILELIIKFKKYLKNENFDKFSWILDSFNTTVPSEFIAAGEDNFI